MHGTERFSVNFRFSNQNTAGNHRKILLLPVQFHFFSDKYGDGGSIFFRTNNKQLVAHIEYRLMIRNTYVSFVTDTGANKLTSQKFFDFNQCFSADRLIAYLKAHHMRLVVRVSALSFQALFLFGHIDAEDVTDSDDRTDNTYHTQRIRTGITQCNLRSVVAQLVQGLIGGTKSRSVRHSSIEDTHHHRQFHTAVPEVIKPQCNSNI